MKCQREMFEGRRRGMGRLVGLFMSPRKGKRAYQKKKRHDGGPDWLFTLTGQAAGGKMEGMRRDMGTQDGAVR